MKLPRLLEEGRVEVRINNYSTYVYQLDRLDEIIAHLNESRKLLTGQDALTAAESRGREGGIKSALEEIRTGRTVNNFGHIPAVVRALEWVCVDVSAILSRLPSPSTMEIEGCEWNHGAEHMRTSCGETVSGHYGQTHCPYCGRPISVKA